MTEITTPSAAFVALGEGFWLKCGNDWYRRRGNTLVWTDVGEDFFRTEEDWRLICDIGTGPWVKYQLALYCDSGKG